MFYVVFISTIRLNIGTLETKCPAMCHCDGILFIFVNCNSQKLYEVPPGLPSNTMLFTLENNAIKSLENLQRQPLINLSTLYLTDNKLRNINSTQMTNLAGLVILDISLNLLFTFDIADFKHMEKLQTIDASSNLIQTLILDQGPPLIRDISLDGNYRTKNRT